MKPFKIKNVILDLEKVSLVKFNEMEGAREPFVLGVVVDGHLQVFFFEDEAERDNFVKVIIEGACHPNIVDYDWATL